MDGAADASEQPLQTIVQGLNQLGLQVTCCDCVPGTQSMQTCTAAPATALLLHLPLPHCCTCHCCTCHCRTAAPLHCCTCHCCPCHYCACNSCATYGVAWQPPVLLSCWWGQHNIGT